MTEEMVARGERRDEREGRERVLRVAAVVVRQVPAWPSGGRSVLSYATRDPLRPTLSWRFLI